jgi:hypothetical protein
LSLLFLLGFIHPVDFIDDVHEFALADDAPVAFDFYGHLEVSVDGAAHVVAPFCAKILLVSLSVSQDASLKQL